MRRTTRHTLVIALAVLFVALVWFWVDRAQFSAPTDTTQSVDVVPTLSGDLLLERVEEQVSFGARAHGTEGYEKWHTWLQAALRDSNGVVVVQEVPYENREGATTSFANVVWRYKPNEVRRIILGTHYDTKILDTSDDPIVPGANDGASGVAVLLGIIDTLSSELHSQPFGVDIVFFDGEEGEPFVPHDFDTWYPIGSTFFVEHLGELYNGTLPEFSIIIDMVCDADLDIRPERSSLREAKQLTSELFTYAQQRYPHTFLLRPGSAIRDDHTPFLEHGIPSTLLIDATYPYWHTTEDTVDKCSADSMEQVAHVLLGYLYTL